MRTSVLLLGGVVNVGLAIYWAGSGKPESGIWACFTIAMILLWMFVAVIAEKRK